jgi:hypothetical protein
MRVSGVSQGRLKKPTRQLKNLHTINRNLKFVIKIIDFELQLRKDLQNEDGLFEQLSKSLDLYSALLHHAVILYARWFLTTNGKMKLKPESFFEKSSSDFITHQKIIDLRNEYIAHNENDILSKDYILININSDGKPSGIRSTFEALSWPNDIDTSKFREVAIIVHNKNSDSINELERRILNDLKDCKFR